MLLLDYVLPGLSLIVAILTLSIFCYVVAKGYRILKEAFSVVENFFDDNGQAGSSPFNQSITNIIEGVGNSTGHGVQRAIASSLGGTMKGATAELEQQAIAENPNLAAIGMMPKSIQKNPLAMIAMQGILGKMANTNPPGANSGNNHSTSNQSAFDI